VDAQQLAAGDGEMGSLLLEVILQTKEAEIFILTDSFVKLIRKKCFKLNGY